MKSFHWAGELLGNDAIRGLVRGLGSERKQVGSLQWCRYAGRYKSKGSSMGSKNCKLLPWAAMLHQSC